MALERQFQPLVEPPDPWNNYPATLEYLRQRTEEKAEELAPWAKAALDHQVGQLTDALLAGEYAKSLAERIWDRDAEPEEYKNYMNETLENPEVELLDRVIKYRPVLVG